VAEEPGLLDALTESGANAASLILPTDVRGLSILPAGKPREGATELLSSSRMAEVASQILGRHPRCIALFDSPPLVVSSESRVLAMAVGQILVVVRAGHTPRQALLDALAELPDGRVVSLVLNQGRHSLIQGYYSQSYGSYGEEENAS
jgi:Mrp family chromosome partitioning ATPase